MKIVSRCEEFLVTMLSCVVQKLKKVTDEATKYKQLYLKNSGKENVPS